MVRLDLLLEKLLHEVLRLGLVGGHARPLLLLKDAGARIRARASSVCSASSSFFSRSTRSSRTVSVCADAAAAAAADSASVILRSRFCKDASGEGGGDGPYFARNAAGYLGLARARKAEGRGDAHCRIAAAAASKSTPPAGQCARRSCRPTFRGVKRTGVRKWTTRPGCEYSTSPLSFSTMSVPSDSPRSVSVADLLDGVRLFDAGGDAQAAVGPLPTCEASAHAFIGVVLVEQRTTRDIGGGDFGAAQVGAIGPRPVSRGGGGCAVPRI